MPTTISTKAVEQSTFIITISFTDSNGDSVAPSSAKWRLVDYDGNAINNRKDVDINSPTAEEDILLSGDDLQVPDGRDEITRWLVVEATYSSSLGSGLPLKDQVEFTVTNLRGVR